MPRIKKNRKKAIIHVSTKHAARCISDKIIKHVLTFEMIMANGNTSVVCLFIFHLTKPFFIICSLCGQHDLVFTVRVFTFDQHLCLVGLARPEAARGRVPLLPARSKFKEKRTHLDMSVCRRHGTCKARRGIPEEKIASPAGRFGGLAA